MAFGEFRASDNLPPESSPVPQPIERSVLESDWAGHFKHGPHLMSAFRMLEQLTDQMATQGVTPIEVEMIINDLLPADTTYISQYDDLNTPHQLTIKRQREINITGQPTPLKFIDRTELFSKVSEPQEINPKNIILNREQIQTILPQGPNIQFIDALITPHRPETLAEAAYRITADDYESIGISDYLYFDRAKLLEGMGQLAYLYFHQQHPDGSGLIPFFKNVYISFNTEYQPQLNELLHYQLTHFETGLTDSKQHGAGTIAGLVTDHAGTRILAKITATVGAMEQAQLARLVERAQRQSGSSTKL